MSVSVLIISHSNVGQALLEAATQTVGELPLATRAIALSLDSQPEAILEELQATIQAADTGDGVLLITDMFGSTPCNLAQQLESQSQQLRIVAGANLPMLIRIMNYPDCDLDSLTEKAVTGGHDGVICCEKTRCEQHPS